MKRTITPERNMHRIFAALAMFAGLANPSSARPQALPARIDHWLPEPSTIHDSFGLAVDVSGEWAVVGAHHEDNRRGAVYVYRRMGLTWVPYPKLVAPPGEALPNDEFGIDVAIDGSTLVVGARQRGNGGPGPEFGKVYVLELQGSDWVHRVRLHGGGVGPGGAFGDTVAVSGDTIVVGSQADDSTCAALYCGAAYVFVRPGASWSNATTNPVLETAKLRSDAPSHGERFGARVAIDGGVIAVTGYHGEHAGVLYAGVVHVFERPPGGWSGTLSPSTRIGSNIPHQYDEFGVGLDVQEDALAGDVVVVGARSQHFNGIRYGAAFVVEEPPGGWQSEPNMSVEPNLLPSPLSPDDHYGLAVAIDGRRIVVTAPLEDTPSGQDWGRAYVFQRTNGQWRERYWLQAPSVDLGGVWPPHLGGAKVALQGDLALVGVHVEDTTSGLDSGAVHVFQLGPHHAER